MRVLAPSAGRRSGAAPFLTFGAQARRGGRVLGARRCAADFRRSAPWMARKALRRGPRSTLTHPYDAAGDALRAVVEALTRDLKDTLQRWARSAPHPGPNTCPR